MPDPILNKEWNGHVGPVVASHNEFDVIECKICGFKHSIPIPTEDELEKVYQQRLRLNPGAQSLIQYAQQQGMKTILVSGGFTFFSDKVKQLLNLDEAHSNTLEIVDGVLTGRVLGQIVDGVCKERLVNEFCLKQNLATSAALVFGDGSNDLLMMESAGLSIGYRPKPIIKEKADGTFNFVGLDGVLDLLKAKA